MLRRLFSARDRMALASNELHVDEDLHDPPVVVASLMLS